MPCAGPNLRSLEPVLMRGGGIGDAPDELYLKLTGNLWGLRCLKHGYQCPTLENEDP